VTRTVVSSRIIDSLIRKKLEQAGACAGVQPLPVVHSREGLRGCNWVIPGWQGDAQAVAQCRDNIRDYLMSLAAQFDIDGVVPEENSKG
jgi:hypothetical protein